MEQPKQQLYMPAEWHDQQMVQLTWPHKDTDWGYMLEEVEECYIELAKAISSRLQLLVVTPDVKGVKETLEKCGATMSNITLFECATNDTWARDHAFITILGDNVPHYVDFCFNGWGRKFEASLDNAINGKLYDAGIVKGEYEDCTSFVLEGGSIESDGKGTILTTSQCLLAPHRNQPMDKDEIEKCLKKMLHAERVLCGGIFLSVYLERSLPAFGTDDFLRMFGGVAYHRKAVFLYAGDKGTPLRTETACDGGFVSGVNDGAAAYGLSSRTVGDDDACRCAVLGNQYVCGHAAVKEIHVAVD